MTAVQVIKLTVLILVLSIIHILSTLNCHGIFRLRFQLF